MQYVLCNLASKSLYAFSVSITMFVKYVASGFAILYWKPIFKNFSSSLLYSGADKSLARPTSRYILFDGENISYDASIIIYINSTNIPPIVIINRIHKNQNLLSL